MSGSCTSVLAEGRLQFVCGTLAHSEMLELDQDKGQLCPPDVQVFCLVVWLPSIPIP